MPHFVALHNQLHQSISIDTSKIEAQGANERMVPVVLGEFLKLVVDYPILFTKSAETGQFLAVALLGFEANENLFWQDQQWQSIYVPLNIHRLPFFVGKENEQSIICIDTQSPCVADNRCHETLFGDQGNDSAYLQKMKSQLAHLLDGEAKTARFTRALLELNLIMPMTLDIHFANRQEQRVQGLYTINEERLGQLDAEQMLQLQAQGYLQPIYTMIASLGQIYALIQKKNERLGYA
jgi:hypothetical protein